MDDRGKPAISAHSIRHTYGTNLIRVGTDIVLVAELIGHNDLETTRLYTLTTEADVKAAVARLPADQLWIFSRHPAVADGSRCAHGPDRDHEGCPAAAAGHGVLQRGTRGKSFELWIEFVMVGWVIRA